MRQDFTGYLLVCDIDGTLAEGQFIHPDNIEAIRRFQAMSGRVVLATGRSPQSSAPVVRRLSEERLMIANNGTILYDCAERRVLWERTLDIGRLVEDIQDKFPFMGILSYWQDKLTLYRHSPIVDHLIADETLTLTDEGTQTPNKLLLGDEPDKLAQAEEYLRERLRGSRIHVVRASPHFTELLPEGADKGSAVLALTERLGIRRDHLFVAGNYYNDITMLDAGCVSCVPCESPDEVKAHADYIARPCTQGALADFIEYLIRTV